MPVLKPWLWKTVSLIFPAVQIWRANRAINQDKTISDYSQSVENNVKEHSGDLEDLVETAKEAQRSELDRNSHLDSKAGNYLANLGVVLSILSLGPIFSVALGLKQNSILTGGWPEGLVLVFFGFALVSLLGSAYYSSKALKMRGYRVYFSADGIKDRIGNTDPNEKQIKELLVCKKENELNNLDKNNLISVAEEFSRNGLISLGLGIGVIITMLLPESLIAQVAQVVCSVL